MVGRDFVHDMRDRSAAVRYATGAALAVLALAATAFTAPALGRPPSILLFAATLFIAWLVGFGPAIVTAAIGVIVLDRIDASVVWRPEARDTLWNALFIAMALGMAWLASATRRLADERRQLLEREAAARLEAEAANRAKEDFLAIVSHELRTPLTVIVGWLHVLRRGQLDPAERERVFETIERNTMLQATLIDDLLDASRAVAGKLQVSMRRVDLGRLVLDTIESMRPRADAAAITLTRSVDSGLLVYADEARLQQVVMNLVSNAIKFTPPAGSIDVTARRRPASASIVVRDSGVGIAPDALPHVFDRFYQAAAALEGRRGLGLGLAIAKYIVELHGGSITAESGGAGQGATFTITLPLDR